MKLRNRKIASKLFFLIFISFIIFGVIGGTGYYFMNQMDKNSENMYKDALLPIKWEDQISTNNRTIDSLVLELLITSDKDMKQGLKEEIATREKENEVLMNQLEEALLSQDEVNNLNHYKEINQIYIEKLDKAIELAFSDNKDLGYATYQDGVKNRDDANVFMGKIEKYLDQYAVDLHSSITKDKQVSTRIIFAVIILAIVLKAVVGFIIVRMIVNPIKEIQGLMENAENGDLTVNGKYVSKDELGQLTVSFNRMMHRLRDLMKQVNITSEQVAASSEELSESAVQTTEATNQITLSIQEIASGAEAQGQGASESSVAMKEMTIGIREVANSTTSVSELAMETSKEANSGNNSLQKVIRQMDTINKVVDDSASVVRYLGEHSKEIGKIIEVITSIADQTNLLALNAAIESARAGEHGRGFAVVADEVRKLAEQSKESADKIAGLIEKIQEDTTFAVDAMDKGTQEVKIGMDVVHEAGEGFKKILGLIEQVTAQTQETSAASEEMSASADQVNYTIEKIASIARVSADNTQTVASASEEQLATMEEVTSSVTELSRMAENLKAQVSQFKVN